MSHFPHLYNENVGGYLDTIYTYLGVPSYHVKCVFMSFIVLKQDVVDVVISILQTSNYGVQNFTKTPKVISQVSSRIKVVFALPKEKKKKPEVEPITTMPPSTKIERTAKCFHRKKPKLNLFFSELRMICNIWQ